jgi:trigger factor
LNFQIVEINGCKRELVGEVPAERLEQDIESLAKKYAKQAKVPGFRPGKVPLSVVRQRFAADIRSEATQELIQSSWRKALDEHKFAPLAEPSVKELKDDPGMPLRFTLAFEVLPNLEVKDYQGVNVTVDLKPVEEKDVDDALEALRNQFAQYIPVEGEIQDGHMVVVNVDGVFEDGGKKMHEDDVNFVVGSPQANETFSANVRGAKAGDERSFDVTYPEDYHRKRFAGKKVSYQVVIKDVKQKHLSELNDEFAKDLGMETVAKLRDRIREDLITKGERNAEMKARETLIDEVIKQNPCDVPDCLVEEELESQARRMAATFARQGIDINKTSINWQKVLEDEKPNATQAVRRLIVLTRVAEQEKLEATEEEIEAEFQKLAEGTGKTAVALRAQFEKEHRLEGFKEHLVRNKALDFMFRNATISRG